MGNLCPKVSESYSPVEIVDGLFVSEGINHSVLSKLGIRRVLIIGGECNAPGVCLTVSLNDQSDLVAQLERCYEFLDQAATGDKAMVIGVTQLAPVIIGYLVTRKAMNLDIARDQFKSKFPSHSVIINTSFSDAISQLPLKGQQNRDPSLTQSASPLNVQLDTSDRGTVKKEIKSEASIAIPVDTTRKMETDIKERTEIKFETDNKSTSMEHASLNTNLHSLAATTCGDETDTYFAADKNSEEFFNSLDPIGNVGWIMNMHFIICLQSAQISSATLIRVN